MGGALPYLGTTPHLDSVRSLATNRVAFVIIGIVCTSVFAGAHRRNQRRNTSLIRTALVLILWSCAFGVVTSMAANLARYAAGGTYLGGWTALGGTVSAVVVFLAWSACYLAANAHADMERERENTLQAQAKAQEAQLNALRGQINPHFLFNALNSIQALIVEDRQLAQVAVEKLAILLRHSLRQTDGDVTSVAEEMDGIGEYLALEKIRFEEKLVVETEVASGVDRVRVPGFLFQPLVENAIKYGMRTSAMPLRVRIRATAKDDSVCFEVANTGKWISPEVSKRNGAHATGGRGLQLVRDRLALSYPGRHRFRRTSQDGWVTQRIEIDRVAERGMRAVSSPAGR